MEIEKERLWRTQLREIGQQFVNGDSAAFFYPMRMYATLIVSVFAMGFWAQGIVNYFYGLAANVRSAQATASPTPRSTRRTCGRPCRVCAPRTCCAVLHTPRAAIAPGARGRREGHHRHPFYAHRAAEQVPQPRLQRPARRGSMLGLEPLP